MSDIPEIVEDLVKSHVPSPYEIYAVEWEKVGVDWVLRVLVDKPEGIEIDETSTLSEIISPLLDTLKPDPFPAEGYMLEVVSPGAERPLKKVQDYCAAAENGEQVLVSCYQKIAGEKEFLGEILSADEKGITLSVAHKSKRESVSIPLSAIAKAQTIIKW